MEALTRVVWRSVAVLALALALALTSAGCGDGPSERSGDAGLLERDGATPSDASAAEADAASRADVGTGEPDAGSTEDASAACDDRDRDGFEDLECGGTDCDDADRAVHPFAPDGPTRACNGVDDDCDGESDEGCACLDGESRDCGASDVGECRFGSQLCIAGAWTECLDARGPEVERCNGADDDCDGEVDDGC